MLFRSIISSNGTVFKNNTGSTTLTAKVLANNQDASGEMTYQWYKDGTACSTGQTLSVFAKDITNTVAYRVEAIDANGTVRGATEVTCANVTDGNSSHIHIAYANSAEGSKDFSTAWFDGAMYFGVYTDDKETASETYTDYKWTRIKGEQGIQGPQGPKGENGAKGDKGDDAVSLYIESSNGNVFKNANIATILTVDIYISGQLITDSTAMKNKFGDYAYLQWKQKEEGAKEWTDISSSDSRLSDNGFMFTVNTDDVNNRIVFSCELNY